MDSSGDVFCRIARHEENAHVIYEDECVMAILDLYPASRGQTLLLPKAHFTWFYEMPDELVAHFYGLVNRLGLATMKAFEPKSIIVLARGLRVPHYHFIMIPAHGDDFMSRLFGFVDAFQGFPPVPDGIIEERLESLRMSAFSRETASRDLEEGKALLVEALKEVLSERPLL